MIRPCSSTKTPQHMKYVFKKKSFATKRQKYTPTTNLWKNTIVMFYQYFDKPSFVSLNCLPHSDGSFDIRNTTFQLLRIPNGSRFFVVCFFYFPKRVWTTVGGGVVKVLILQFFLDMEMVCTWSHKSRLSKILHFLHRCCLFPRMPYFLFSILEKKNMFKYNDFDACNEFCIILSYILPYVHIIYIYTLFDKFIVFFTIGCVSR